jgi:hypothetical protein
MNLKNSYLSEHGLKILHEYGEHAAIPGQDRTECRKKHDHPCCRFAVTGVFFSKDPCRAVPVGLTLFRV